MDHKTLLAQINRGVLIKRDQVVDTDPENVTRRSNLLDQFRCVSTTVKPDTIIGVQPVTFINTDKLNLLWAVSVLRKHESADSEYVAIDPSTATEVENEAVQIVRNALMFSEMENMDIQSVLFEHGFEKYRFKSGEKNG